MTSLLVKSLLATVAVTAMATAAYADPVLTNGNFEMTNLPSTQSAGFGPRTPSTVVDGWTSTGYNFVFQPGSNGVAQTGNNGTVALYGGVGAAPPPSSPAGGNFLALDGSFEVGAVAQTVTGLSVGTPMTVSFYFAGAQQYGYSGTTTEQLQVSLGSESQLTQVLNNASMSVTPWNFESFIFTPTSTSDVLSFLSIGTPTGVPPLALLDGVTVTGSASPVPEPSTLALLATGFAGLSGIVRSRFKK